MAKKVAKKSAKKTTKKTKSTGSSKAKSTKTQSRAKSSNRKTAPQVNPFEQQGGYPQAAQAAQGAQEQGMFARGGKLKRKKCKR